MTSIIPLRSAFPSGSVPLILMIDLQQEYTSEGRAHHIQSGFTAAQNCVRLLEGARQARLPIAHFRQIADGHFFNRQNRFFSWIDGLTPRPSEYVYERTYPSCFSNAEFCALMETIAEPDLIVAGLSGEYSCLSTIIDGYQRGYKMTFVSDCSASCALDSRSEKDCHDFVTSVVSVYAATETLEHMASWFAKAALLRRGGR